MKKLNIIIVILIALLVNSCTENYSNGERIGFISKFSKKGLIWDSWEGDMTLTQTGMNQSANSDFPFSIDNNNEPPGVVATIDSAANQGWKVKLVYHEVYGRNITKSRGLTNHFIKQVVVLDKHPMANMFGNHPDSGQVTGKVIDTIYVVIYKDKPTIK